MTDELRFALQLSLNLIAVLLAGWLAGYYATRRVQKVLEVERRRAEEARRQAQADVVASLPPIPPEVEQLIEIERWILGARDLQILLTSLCTLIRIRLGAGESNQHGVLGEIDHSLKFLGRQENKWLNDSLAVVADARQLDPAEGKTRDQSLETWLSRLNQAYVRAAQSVRRAAYLCAPDNDEAYGDTMANAYLTEADRAAANMASLIASTLDRVAYIKQQLPEQQLQQVAAAIAELAPDGCEPLEAEAKNKNSVAESADPATKLTTSAGNAAR